MKLKKPYIVPTFGQHRFTLAGPLTASPGELGMTDDSDNNFFGDADANSYDAGTSQFPWNDDISWGGQ